MRFKRAMAASMAAVMAVSSAVVCQITASAAVKSIDLSGFAGWGKTVVDAGNNKITFAAGYGGCGYWSNPGLDGYDELVLTYHDLTTDALTLVAKVDDDNKAEKYANNASGEIVVDITGLDRANIGSLMITGGENAGSVVIDSIIARNSATFGEEKVLWSGTSKTNDTYEADSSVDLSKLSDNAVFTITLTTDDSSGVQAGWGIGQVVANDVWTDKKTVVIASPGQSVTNGTFTFTKKQLLEASGETTLSSLKIQSYNGGATLTKLTVKDVDQSEVPVSDVKIAAPAKTTYNVGDEVTLTASVNDDATVEDKDIVWSSDNTDVATVDETTGKVKFVGAGNVTVTAAYKSDKTIKDTVALKAEKKKVTATITAGDVTGATKEDAADKAKAAVKVVSDDLTDKDYTVSVKVDGRKYMATVVLTEEAAKKYELTGTNTASGTIAYKVTGLKLSTNKLAIPVTSTAGVKITATIEPEDLADGEVEWKTADNTVATVEDGLVKPVSGSAGGKTTITATVKGTTYSADCEVSIAEVINPATAIKLDKSELSGTAGDKAELKADVTAKDDTKECTDVVIWESSDEKVATVNAGSVTFVGEGTAEIIVTAGDVSAACKVTVKAKTVAVEKVTLDKTSAELTVGGTAALKATVTPDNATDKTVTWTSSDESVATVKDGTVTAVKAGKAVITAKAGDQIAECTVTVKAKEEKPEEKPDPAPAVNEKEIWSGSTDLGTDWGKSVTVPKADVKIGDTIRIKVSTGSAEYHQVKIMDSSWNVLSSVKSKADAQYGTITVDKDGYVEFVVNAADAKLISEGGLIISGYDLTISAVSSRAMKEETYAPSTKVHTVVNNGSSQIAVFAISEEDAEKYESYTIIITRGSDGKSVYEIVDGCYKYVSYNNGSENVRVSGNGAYYIMLDITGIEDSFGGITVKIVPTVPKG